jgi:hypothetical protein
METKNNICSICYKKYVGFGNNAQPLNSGRCCNNCNSICVIPARWDILIGDGLHTYRDNFNPENVVKSTKLRNADED